VNLSHAATCNLEEFEDTKGVIRIRISKNRQHYAQKKGGTKVVEGSGDRIRSPAGPGQSRGRGTNTRRDKEIRRVTAPDR
jgi:hypothetical protein